MSQTPATQPVTTQPSGTGELPPIGARAVGEGLAIAALILVLVGGVVVAIAGEETHLGGAIGKVATLAFLASGGSFVWARVRDRLARRRTVARRSAA